MRKYVKILKNAIWPKIIIFLVNLSGLILFAIKYVKYNITLVPINVTIENIIGKNAHFFAPISQAEKLAQKSTTFDKIAVNITIIILQINQAIKLQNEFIAISQIEIFCGQKWVIKIF